MLLRSNRAMLLLGLTLAACSRTPPPTGPSPGSDEAPIELLGRPTPVAAAPVVALPPLPIDIADFDLPVHDNEHVRRWLDVFQNRNRRQFVGYLERKGRYEPMIREQLAARGLPQDLIYLALIESGFVPRAVSRAKAVGMWQFMAPTAVSYGLEVSERLDERRDPLRSTEAAARHLQGLYKQFGSWYLAAAAYNSGGGRVARLLNEHAGGARGSDSLFWAIAPHLPRETRDYVPLLIAATIIGKYPDRFGFGDVRSLSPERLDRVEIPDETELNVLARLANVAPERLRELNPHLVGDRTPPKRSVSLHLPVGAGAAFRKAYAALPPEQRVPKQVHVVEPGETLSGIAARYATTVRQLQSANDIDDPSHIRSGQKLKLPQGALAAAPSSPEAASAEKSSRHASDKDTPETNRSATTAAAGRGSAEKAAAGKAPAEKAAAEADSPNSAPATRSPKAKSSSEVTPHQYTVRAGDSLWGIAKAHDVTIAQLREWNALDESPTIRPGQLLDIAPPVRVLRYTVKGGDSLWGIARSHNITIADLREWNGLNEAAVIRPGDELELRLVR